MKPNLFKALQKCNQLQRIMLFFIQWAIALSPLRRCALKGEEETMFGSFCLYYLSWISNRKPVASSGNCLRASVSKHFSTCRILSISIHLNTSSLIFHFSEPCMTFSVQPTTGGDHRLSLSDGFICLIMNIQLD